MDRINSNNNNNHGNHTNGNHNGNNGNNWRFPNQQQQQQQQQNPHFGGRPAPNNNPRRPPPNNGYPPLDNGQQPQQQQASSYASLGRSAMALAAGTAGNGAVAPRREPNRSMNNNSNGGAPTNSNINNHSNATDTATSIPGERRNLDFHQRDQGVARQLREQQQKRQRELLQRHNQQQHHQQHQQNNNQQRRPPSQDNSTPMNFNAASTNNSSSVGAHSHHSTQNNFNQQQHQRQQQQQQQQHRAPNNNGRGRQGQQQQLQINNGQQQPRQHQQPQQPHQHQQQQPQYQQNSHGRHQNPDGQMDQGNSRPNQMQQQKTQQQKQQQQQNRRQLPYQRPNPAVATGNNSHNNNRGNNNIPGSQQQQQQCPRQASNDPRLLAQRAVNNTNNIANNDNSHDDTSQEEKPPEEDEIINLLDSDDEDDDDDDDEPVTNLTDVASVAVSVAARPRQQQQQQHVNGANNKKRSNSQGDNSSKVSKGSNSNNSKNSQNDDNKKKPEKKKTPPDQIVIELSSSSSSSDSDDDSDEDDDDAKGKKGSASAADKNSLNDHNQARRNSNNSNNDAPSNNRVLQMNHGQVVSKPHEGNGDDAESESPPIQQQQRRVPPAAAAANRKRSMSSTAQDPIELDDSSSSSSDDDGDEEDQRKMPANVRNPTGFRRIARKSVMATKKKDVPSESSDNDSESSSISSKEDQPPQNQDQKAKILPKINIHNNKENRDDDEDDRSSRKKLQQTGSTPPALSEEIPPQEEAAAIPNRKRPAQDDDAGDDSDEEFEEAGQLLATAKAASIPFGARRCPSSRSKPARYDEGMAQPEPTADDFITYNSPKSSSKRDADADDENRTEMLCVDFLTKLTINPETGLPTKTITCHGDSAEILYDFRVDVGTSGIPNSGHGAFLTFLGARHLKAAAYKKGAAGQHKKQLHCHDELEANGYHGFGINVKFIGEVVNNGKFERPRGIGPNFVYDESDYEESQSTVFSANGRENGIIHLGVYGPFRTCDRKPKDTQFNVKSFIFNHEPSEWCFGATEQLFGREDQIIDITDDVTGKTHEIAMSNIPMHVNEVGHNKELIMNVDALERHDRSVHYYMNIVETMKKGDRVELLTSYGAHYEDVRERKGYGLRNINEGLIGDENPKDRFELNVAVRDVVATSLEDLRVYSTYCMMEFVEEKIRTPIATLSDRFLRTPSAFIATGKVPVPACLQWVAMVRMHWLWRLLVDHLDILEEREKLHPQLLQLQYPSDSMLRQCRSWAESLKWTSIDDFWRLDSTIEDAEGNNIRDAVDFEVVEHIWFELRKELPSPFDRAIWCPIGCDLIETLCKDVALLTWTENSSGRLLRERIYKAAGAAAKKIREQAANYGGEKASEGLEFESGVVKDSRVTAEQVASLRKSHFEYNTLNPKGLLAALSDLHAYYDCTFLLEDHKIDTDFSLPSAAHDEKYLMFKYECFTSGLTHLSSVPKSVANGHKQSASVNESWYIMWQVVYIAHTFASKYIPDGEKVPEHEKHSLKKLCERTGMDLSLAQKCVEQGIRPRNLEEKIPKKRHVEGLAMKTSNKTRKSTVGTIDPSSGQVLHNAFGTARPAATEIWVGPPDEPLPGGWPLGWTKRVFERQSGVSKGHRDRYWFSPQKSNKFRSMLQVKKYMGCLATTGGNEEYAWKLFKGK